MVRDDAITYPVVGPGFPRPGTFALLAASQADLSAICRHFAIEPGAGRPLYTSRLYVGADGDGRFALVGPAMGAPYATMLLETLIVAGVRRVVFWGWCGAVSGRVKIGDLVVPDAAIIDEGTSRHYQLDPVRTAVPSAAMVNAIRKALTLHGASFHEGAVWTTDAIFRETRTKVAHYQARGVLAVEMETSALFTVANFRGVEIGALLVVSDELAGFTWARGFSDARFRENCRQACKVIGALCRDLQAA